jgi:hypothetical protein
MSPQNEHFGRTSSVGKNEHFRRMKWTAEALLKGDYRLRRPYLQWTSGGNVMHVYCTVHTRSHFIHVNALLVQCKR